MSVGEIGLKSRRPSTPGANTQLIYNQAGVDGANANLTFDYATSNLTVGGNVFITRNISSNGWIASHGQFPQGGTAGISAIVNVAGGGTYVGAEAKGNLQTIQMFTANATLDNAWWEIQSQNAGLFLIRSANDTYGNIATAIAIRRANANSNIGSITLGNGNDLPNTHIQGNANVQGNIVVTSNVSTGNLSVTQNTSAGNISTANITVSAVANLTTANIPTLISPNTWVYTNGASVLGVANINFVNTAAVTWTVTPNGTQQVNVTASASGGPGGGGGVAYADGTLVLGMANANVNYVSSATINSSVIANGTTGVDVSFVSNTAALSTFGVIVALDMRLYTSMGMPFF